MTKADIINDIVTNSGVSKREVGVVVESFMQIIKCLPSWIWNFRHQTSCSKNRSQHSEEYNDCC